MLKKSKQINEEPKVNTETLSHSYSGKLLLRNEIDLQESEFIDLVDRGFFTPKESIKKMFFSSICQRCGNRKRSLFGMSPSPNNHAQHIYCRKCINMGRVIQCAPLYYWSGPNPKWPSQKNPLTWKGTLTEQQQFVANRIVRKIKSKESNKLLIWAVTGSGKTEMLFLGISKALQSGYRVCVATPRADVVRELLPRMKKAFAHTHIQGLYSGSEDNDGIGQLIIATTHQLLRYKRAFDVLIIDEIDAFPYHADRSLPFATNRAKKMNSTTIYLTATPRMKHQKQIAKKQLPHLFVPMRFHGHPLPVPRFKICFSLKKDLQNFLPPKAFISWFKQRKCQKRQLLIFVPTVKLAEKLQKNLANYLKSEGLISSVNLVQSVHAHDDEREKLVQLFREKKFSLLITTTILERGVTFPSVDVAVLDAGHVVFDEAGLVQIAGRAGRSSDDPKGEVVFFHEGKTNALTNSVYSIIEMNKRAGF